MICDESEAIGAIEALGDRSDLWLWGDLMHNEMIIFCIFDRGSINHCRSNLNVFERRRALAIDVGSCKITHFRTKVRTISRSSRIANAKSRCQFAISFFFCSEGLVCGLNFIRKTDIIALPLIRVPLGQKIRAAIRVHTLGFCSFRF